MDKNKELNRRSEERVILGPLLIAGISITSVSEDSPGVFTVRLSPTAPGSLRLQINAGALVTEGKEFPDGSMIMGSPAKVVRELSPEQIEGLKNSAKNYIKNAQRFQSGLKKIV